MCTTKKDPESEWLTRGYPESNSNTIKPRTASHVAEQSSWVSLPSSPPPRQRFPIKSLALSTRVSPQTIHFRVLDKSPLSAQQGIPLPATASQVVGEEVGLLKVCAFHLGCLSFSLFTSNTEEEGEHGRTPAALTQGSSVDRHMWVNLVIALRKLANSYTSEGGIQSSQSQASTCLPSWFGLRELSWPGTTQWCHIQIPEPQKLNVNIYLLPAAKCGGNLSSSKG